MASAIDDNKTHCVECYGTGEFPPEFATNTVLIACKDSRGALDHKLKDDFGALEVISSRHENLFQSFVVLPSRRAAVGLAGTKYTDRRGRCHTVHYLSSGRDLMLAFNKRDINSYRRTMAKVNKYCEDQGVELGPEFPVPGDSFEDGCVFVNEDSAATLATNARITPSLADLLVKERALAPFVHWGELLMRVPELSRAQIDEMKESGSGVRLTSTKWYLNRQILQHVTAASTKGWRLHINVAGDALDVRMRPENHAHMVEQRLEDPPFSDNFGFSTEYADGSVDE